MRLWVSLFLETGLAIFVCLLGLSSNLRRDSPMICDMRWPCVAWLLREIPMIGAGR